MVVNIQGKMHASRRLTTTRHRGNRDQSSINTGERDATSTISGAFYVQLHCIVGKEAQGDAALRADQEHSNEKGLGCLYYHIIKAKAANSTCVKPGLTGCECWITGFGNQLTIEQHLDL